MTGSNVRACAVLLLLVLAPLAAAAATIELKDGTIVTGTIQGNVVLGGRVDEKTPGGIFFVIAGADIASITKKGVETGKDPALSWALFAGKKLPATPVVLDLVMRLTRPESLGGALGDSMRLGATQFAAFYDHNPIKVALMGEYTTENGGAVLPALRVQTEAGLKTIAIGDVVDYVAAAAK